VRFVLAGAIVGAALLAPPAAPASSALTATLKEVPYTGEFGTGYKLIFQLTRNNRPVTHLPVGTYTLVVDDQSKVLNFHLTRANGTEVRSLGVGGTRIVTGVEKKEKRTFVVRLTRGTYVAFSDPHASSIRKTFRVG
jgi:hypothetical protein